MAPTSEEPQIGFDSLPASQAVPCPVQIDSVPVCLQHFSPSDDGRSIIQSVSLSRFPFKIGRDSSCDHVVPSDRVSKEHAELVQYGSHVYVKDLFSTNGTYVNGKRIVRPTPLRDGDILHIAQKEFCVVFEGDPANREASSENTEPSRVTCDSRLRSFRALKDLLDQGNVSTVFQPIVRLEGGQTVAFESLARGSSAALPNSPAELLVVAKAFDLDRDLNRVFRSCSMRDLRHLPVGPAVFVNLHPADLVDDDAIAAALAEVNHGRASGHKIVLEVPERAVTELDRIRFLRSEARKAGLQIAYDDFGAGESRLVELAEVPPDFVKLDIALIRNIHRSRSRRDIVGALVDEIRQWGVAVIAEGIELPEERDVCQELGCQFGQGYLFARPQPATAFC